MLINLQSGRFFLGTSAPYLSTVQATHTLIYSFKPNSYKILKSKDKKTCFGRAMQINFCLLIALCSSFVISENIVMAADNIPDTDSLLVYFEEGTDEETRQHVLEGMNAILIDWTEALNMAEVQINSENEVRASLDTSIFSHSLIAAVEADTAIVRGTYMPNDPALQEREKSYAQEVIQMEEAWDYTLGDPSTVVAIVDTGLNPQHIEFGTPVIAGYNFLNNTTNYRDDHGHGTHVAGIVAAQMNNSIGTVGICPQCSLIVVKVLNQDNYGRWSTVSKGIVYAVDNGADIINLSLGSDESSHAIESAIAYAHENDVLIIAASGNERSGIDFYPSAFADVIGVSATNDYDEHWVLSNYGNNIDLSAPGYMIYSTGGEENFADNDAFSYMTGTSMAAPHVAGIAGLLLSQSANRTSAEITQILLSTSDDLGEEGWDPQFGHGRVNAAQALADAGIEPSTQAYETTEIDNRSSKHQLLLPLVTK